MQKRRKVVFSKNKKQQNNVINKYAPLTQLVRVPGFIKGVYPSGDGAGLIHQLPTVRFSPPLPNYF